MKKLFEIVKEVDELKKELLLVDNAYKNNRKNLIDKINKLHQLKKIGSDGIDIEKVQIAEQILDCKGDPDTSCEGKILTELACIDIANDSHHLRKKYFGNKIYEGYYQRTDCKYGMGPSHGSIVDIVGLYTKYRSISLSDEEKDACIYYLKNYSKIKAIKS